MPREHKINEETKKSIVDLVNNEINAHITYVAQQTGRTTEEVLQNYQYINFREIKDLPSLSTKYLLADTYKINTHTIKQILKSIDVPSIKYRAHIIRSETIRRLNADPEFAKAHSERMKRRHTDPEYAKAYSERMKRRHADPEFAKAHSERMKRRHADPEFVKANSERASERMKILHADPEFAKAHSERMKKLHTDPEYAKAHSERMKRLHTDPEYAKANSERASEIMKRRHADPEFAKAHSERGKKMSEALRHNRYLFQGNFYDSQSEAVCGTLMEKYIPGYQVIEHKTFQINTEIPKTIDFLVNGIFIEWHPILAFYGKYNIGDIPTRQEAETYKKTKESLEGEERKDFEKEYQQYLALNYYKSRQEAINQSQNYQGSELILVQTPQELYDTVITRLGNYNGTRDEFITEFKITKKIVKNNNKERIKKENNSDNN